MKELKEDFVTIKQPQGPVRGRVSVPGSKSITQRALVAAALADGTSCLKTPLDSEDTRLLRKGLGKLGIKIEEDKDGWTVHGQAGRISPCEEELFLGNNGTGIRFMASVVCLGEGTYTLTGTERMSERPIEPLLDGLRRWGARAESIEGTGCPPVSITASGLSGGETQLAASKSSQFLSSLLLVAPYTREPARIVLDGPLVSRPYVDITKAVMKSFGVEVEEMGEQFLIPKSRYQGIEYPVEGDASSASYFWAAAAVTGGEITVSNIPDEALQGDAAFADILAQMGCRVQRSSMGVTVKGPDNGELKAIDIDMEKWPDMVPTLAAVAAFARGTTRIRNVAHLRIKETDRLKAVATELGRLGIEVKELDDGLVIQGGGSPRGALIETYDDHRIAMAFAVLALRIPQVSIKDPGCVRKSFPEFWQVWDRMNQGEL